MPIKSYKPLLALTVWQPWAWAIAEGHKLVENRDWPPPRTVPMGTDIAIHAAVRKVDPLDVADVRQGVFRSRGDRRLENWQVPEAESPLFIRGGLVAVARLDAVVTSKAGLPHQQRGWFFGSYGWVFSNVRKLSTPIPLRGMQGLWSVPGSELFQVYEQLAGGAS